jgi:hypothetical protein
MTTPMSANELRRLVGKLRAALAVVRGPRLTLPANTVLRLDEVEQRLLAALERDEGPGPAHDGYPSGSVGAGGEYAPRSSTEAAVLASYRLDPEKHPERSAGWWKEPSDPHHKLTTEAAAALRTMTDAWVTLLARLDAIEDRSEKSKHSNPGGACIVCGRWVEGTAEDRLRRSMCDTDYRAWKRAGEPPLVFFREVEGGPERARWNETA